MAEAEKVVPCKFFCSILTGNHELREASLSELESQFGDIEDRSPDFDFSGTDYYRAEMGEGLKRTFVSFRELHDPSDLSGFKCNTQELEKNMASRSKECLRPVNLDPGLIARGRLILATMKDFSHRIYIGGQVYAEVTLLFKKGKVEYLPWTYPDFRSGAYDEFLLKIREKYHQALE